MTGFKLPRGYSRIPPDAEASILVDDRGLYGGADISDHYDALGTHFVLCCATGPGDPAFRLRGFRRPFNGVKYVEVPLAIEPEGMVITGRGNSDIQWIDGTIHFAGWRDKAFFLGTIPSFVPFPSIPSLDARIKALEVGIVVPPPGSSGGITLAPAPITSPAWEGRTLEGGILVDVPAVFGVPSSSAYLIRFVAQAGAANVRVRAGTQAAPFFVTVNTQVPGLQVHTQGWTPGPEVWISTANGAAVVWLQIVGYS